MQIKSQKITPYLWYDNQAKEAATFYCSLFENSKVLSDDEMIVEFELDGLRILALNGGPQYQLTEAFSLFVLCEDQQEVDQLWQAITSDGGVAGRCGWCKDKFGLSWQIVPKRFMEMMQIGTPDQRQNVINAMMPMHKMVVAEFEHAFNKAK